MLNMNALNLSPWDTNKYDVLFEKSKQIGTTSLIKVLTKMNLCKSSSDARRLIKGGAVRVNGEKIFNEKYEIWETMFPFTLKVGKQQTIKVILQ